MPISEQAYNLCGEPKEGELLVFCPDFLTLSWINRPVKKWIEAAGIIQHITFHCLGTATQPCNWLEELIFIRSAKCWDIQMCEQHRCMQRLLMKRKRKLQKPLNWIYLKQNNHYYTL